MGNGKFSSIWNLLNYGCEDIFCSNLIVGAKEVIKVTDPFLMEILEYWAETNLSIK